MAILLPLLLFNLPGLNESREMTIDARAAPYTCQDNVRNDLTWTACLILVQEPCAVVTCDALVPFSQEGPKVLGAQAEEHYIG